METIVYIVTQREVDYYGEYEYHYIVSSKKEAEKMVRDFEKHIGQYANIREIELPIKINKDFCECIEF